jgi:hypothetical protein
VEKVSKEKWVNLLRSKNTEDKKTVQAADKIEQQKRLSSEEFLKVYKNIWKEGPSVKFQNPNYWNKNVHLLKDDP